ncbi:MAG: hypothetical protein AAF502_18990 [Bacteroidota bacterium]
MEHLFFKLLNKDIQCVIVSKEVLYMLTDKEYAQFKESPKLEVLKKFTHVKKEEISSITTLKGKTEVSIFDLNHTEVFRLNFESTSMRKQFIHAFPNFKKQLDISRIHPFIAFILILITYSFIWAGTRPTPDDINPEGIRLKLASLTVWFLEWLNSLIGQQLILYIGITLILILLYFIFRPELWNLFGRRLKYSNEIISGPLK